jgi:hypothetical protein
MAAPAPPAIILAESTPPVHSSKPAAKTQWKVVDINELEPRSTRPQMVADRQPGLVRLGLKIDLSTQNH